MNTDIRTDQIVLQHLVEGPGGWGGGGMYAWDDDGYELNFLAGTFCREHEEEYAEIEFKMLDDGCGSWYFDSNNSLCECDDLMKSEMDFIEEYVRSLVYRSRLKDMCDHIESRKSYYSEVGQEHEQAKSIHASH